MNQPKVGQWVRIRTIGYSFRDEYLNGRMGVITKVLPGIVKVKCYNAVILKGASVEETLWEHEVMYCHG